jgi:hypothetical protein
MPLTFTTLGHVLVHIYDFDPGGTIYLPKAERYEAETPCIVAWSTAHAEEEYHCLHQTSLKHGFTNWLNVAVVSDTCDSVAEKSQRSLIAEFNDDCREGGWLWKMMNYRNPDSTPQPPP